MPGNYVVCVGRRAHHEIASPTRTWPAQVRIVLIVGSLRCQCPAPLLTIRVSNERRGS